MLAQFLLDRAQAFAQLGDYRLAFADMSRYGDLALDAKALDQRRAVAVLRARGEIERVNERSAALKIQNDEQREMLERNAEITYLWTAVGGWRLAVGGLLVSGLLIYLLRTRNKHAKAFEAQASILRSMSEGVMTLEAGGGLRAINAALERIFGYSAQEFGALDLAALGIDADPRAHPMPLSWECLMRRKDGTEFPGIVTFTPRAPENPGEFIVVIEDITELKRLERALMEASAQEQQRLGRELHDGLGQELTGLALIARSLAGTARKADLAIAAELENLSAIASRAIDTCRGMARGLSPASDVQGGLPQALSDLARRIGEAHAIEVNFHSKITAPLSLTPDAIDQVYRISQEALNNAVKHAGASRVDVEFEVGPSRARLQIIDDGPETNPDFNAAKGMGLQSMRYRASLIGARFAIGRAHPSGTKISCEWRQ